MQPYASFSQQILCQWALLGAKNACLSAGLDGQLQQPNRESKNRCSSVYFEQNEHDNVLLWGPKIRAEVSTFKQ